MGKQMVILDFLMEADSVEAVNNESLSLERLHQEVCDANVQFVLFGAEEPSEEEIENDKEQQLWLQAVDEAFLEYKKRVCAWLIEKDKLQQQFSTTRGGARSRASSIVSSIKSQGSNLSHRSNRSTAQEAKIAGLKAEAEAIKRTKEAELNAEMMYIQQKIDTSGSQEGLLH